MKVEIEDILLPQVLMGVNILTVVASLASVVVVAVVIIVVVVCAALIELTKKLLY